MMITKTVCRSSSKTRDSSLCIVVMRRRKAHRNKAAHDDNGTTTRIPSTITVTTPSTHRKSQNMMASQQDGDGSSNAVGTSSRRWWWILNFIAILLAITLTTLGVSLLRFSTLCGDGGEAVRMRSPSPNKRPWWQRFTRRKKKKKNQATRDEEGVRSGTQTRICRVGWKLKTLWSSFLPSQTESTATAKSLDHHHEHLAYSRSSLGSAFSEEWVYTSHQERVAKQVGARVRQRLEEERRESHHHHTSVDQRLSAVSWGGPGGGSGSSTHSHWWYPTKHFASPSSFDGSNLLAGYLKIMKFPDDLKTNFPFSHCKKNRCDADFALMHTLRWRELYKPWCVSPSALQENKDGLVYLRGYSRSVDDHHNRSSTTGTAVGGGGGHGMVWIRFARGHAKDAASYFRAVLQTLDMAVMDSLQRTQGRIGKFNLVLDANHLHVNQLPSLGDTQKAIFMLQDHFPDRLGMVLLTNLSRPAEFLLSLVKPLITKEVREKLAVLPHNEEMRLDMLRTVIEEEFIPDYLGGTDTFRFSPDTYYEKRHLCSEAEATAYLEHSE